MDDPQELERFHPVLLYSILEATRRFEPDFYAHLCRSYHIDAERILGLFSEVEIVGGGQLAPILRDLRAHHAYHEIVFLAGRNSLLIWVELHRTRRPAVGNAAALFTSLTHQLLPPFLGAATFSLLLRGELHFVELCNSVFSRGVRHAHPLCGYYAGFLSELARFSGSTHAVVTETQCTALDPDSQTCVLQVAL